MTMFDCLPPQDSPQMELPLTQFVADSRARISPLPEKARELMASAVAYGAKLPDLLANYDRASSSWKTAQLCLGGGLAEFSETFPRSGMIRNGIAYRLPTLVPRTSGTVSGLLPTLTVSGNYNRKGASKTSGDGLATAVKRMLPTLTAQDAKNNGSPSQMLRNTLPLNAVAGGPLNPQFCEWLMGYPIDFTALRGLETP